ncbi:hypothetical protein [Photobacterium sanguinicancri]|uniref:CxxH/CxxC protein n=1 Tax=Photobacterium sanguinicancri TaxID=875932 RepID=A0ABX4FSU7_9GAMM|nr:hypothetical protein [Photobacterium sanguinicancri]OZS41836.1 hypothetical protein ASV53_21615 [Photobacterium sanguinicancri]
MECSNEACLQEIDIDLSLLDCESNGSSGNHTTSYTYTGVITCDNCQIEHEVTINTDEVDDTGEVIDINIQ